MVSRMALLFLGLGMVTGSGPAGVGDSSRHAKHHSVTTPQANLDSHGDPLPRGAVWRIGTNRFLHDGPVRALAFSPDGKLLASGGPDRAIRLWDSTTGKESRILSEHEAEVCCLRFSADGSFLASGDQEGFITLWHRGRCEKIHQFYIGINFQQVVDLSEKASIRALSFSQDGKILAAARGDKMVWWDTGTGQELGRTSKLGHVQALAVSADGKGVSFLTAEKLGYLDSATGKILCSHDGPAGRVASAFVHSHLLAWKDEGGNLHLWDLAAGKEREVISDAFHNRQSAFEQIVVSGGKTVAAIAGGLECCHLATGKTINLTDGPADGESSFSALAISADGKTIASADVDHRIRLWDAAAGKEKIPLPEARSGKLQIGFSGDGKALGTLSNDGALRLWDIGTGKLIRKIDKVSDQTRHITVLPDGQKEAAFAGKTLASVDEDGQIWLWDTRTSKPIRRLAGQGSGASVLILSADGRLLAGNPGEKNITLWETGSGKVLARIEGHRSPVKGGAFTADGRRLITTSTDGTVLAWDLKAAQELWQAGKSRLRLDGGNLPLPEGARARLGSLRTFPFPLSDLAFSPDGKMIAVAAYKEFSLADDAAPGICVLDVATGKDRLFLESCPAEAAALAYSPDGKTLAGVHESVLFFWDAANGKLRAQLVLEEKELRVLKFSPDGKMVAAAGKTIHLVDLAAGKVLHVLAGHQTDINSLGFSPDGKLLASSSSFKKEQASGDVPGAILLWDLANGKLIREIATSEKEGFDGIRFSPDSKTLMSVVGYQIIRTWEAKSGRCLGSIEAVRENDNTSAIAFCADGKYLAAADMWIPIVVSAEPPSIHLWDLANGKRFRSIPLPDHQVCKLTFSPDGKYLACTALSHPSGLPRLFLWDSANGRPIHPGEGHQQTVRALACSGDGKLLLSGGADGVVCVWDVASGKEVRRLAGHAKPVLAVAVSLDRKTAASLDADNTVCLWDINEGKRLQRFPLPPDEEADLGSVWQLAFSAKIAFTRDGRQLALDPQGNLHVWSIKSRPKTRSCAGIWDFSADGQLLARQDEEEHIIHLTGGKKLDYRRGDDRIALACTTFSPDRRLLAMSNGTFVAMGLGGYMTDPQVILWDSHTGKKRLTIDTECALSVLAFSPDRKVLATGPGDTSGSYNPTPPLLGPRIHLWDLQTGNPLGRLQGHQGTITALTYSPDGRFLFSGSEDGTILIWDNVYPKKGRVLHDLTTGQLLQAWSSLGGDDARAFRSITILEHGDDKVVVPFLTKRLKAVPAVEPATLAHLIADLGSDRFADRNKASSALHKLGELAEFELRQTLKDTPSLEVRRRIQYLLEKIDVPLTPDRLRAVRAVEVLEHIGSPEAQQVLQRLAQGCPGALLTQEAAAAFDRLKKELP